MSLDLYRLINNPYAKVKVAFDGGDVVDSFISEDQGFTFGNKFDAPFESMGEGISNLVSKFKTGIGALSSADVGQAAAQMRVQSVLQTILMWTGSERMSFQLKLIFVALQPRDDVRNKIRPFIDATNPIYNGLTVTAPLKYNAVGTERAQGGASIQIGAWFRTPPFFVVRSFNPTFSRTAITGLGSPLYCIADVHFESYRMLSAPEVQDMFTFSGAGG